jgi:hypothetical protein
MTEAYIATVIPAQAGIQAISSTRAAGQDPIHGFVRYAELYDGLDSGLRRNDGFFGFVRCLYLCKAH